MFHAQAKKENEKQPSKTTHITRQLKAAVSDGRESKEMKLKRWTLELATLHKLGLTSPHPKVKTCLGPIKTPNQNVKVKAEQSK